MPSNSRNRRRSPKKANKGKEKRGSVIGSDQQKAIAAKLAARPAEEELEAKNVKPASGRNKKNKKKANVTSPGLAAVQKKLERKIVSDSLNQKLGKKAKLEDVEASGIIKSTKVAPRLQQAQVALEKQFTKDHLGHLLEGRPTDEALEAANVLDDATDVVAPAIAGQKHELQKNLARSNLYHALRHRPSVIELAERGIYMDPGFYYDDDDSGGEGEYLMADSDNEFGSGGSDDGAASAAADAAMGHGYQRRSKSFHLTRILLKVVAAMTEEGELTLQQKGALKDLIVDQDTAIMQLAEAFDAENDVADFKDSLVRMAASAQ